MHPKLQAGQIFSACQNSKSQLSRRCHGDGALLAYGTDLNNFSENGSLLQAEPNYTDPSYSGFRETPLRRRLSEHKALGLRVSEGWKYGTATYALGLGCQGPL